VSHAASAPLRLSVIVPAWNDHVSLACLLPALVRLKGLHEVIVADASPYSATAELARTGGAIYLAARQPNRGAQMNLAAERATGDVLIFHHADSILTAAHVAAIERALRDPETIGGAFYRKFDGRHPRLRWLEVASRLFTEHGGSFFGDQSIFVRRGTFCALGGFAPIPLMEDMEFSRRLRRAGRVAVLDPPVESSPRRHARRGPWRTSLQNGLFIVLYKCGLSPRHLHRWYYRTQPSVPDQLVLFRQAIEEMSRR
jgi:rSAM/selenodomain-associated transferase 2